MREIDANEGCVRFIYKNYEIFIYESVRSSRILFSLLEDEEMIFHVTYFATYRIRS